MPYIKHVGLLAMALLLFLALTACGNGGEEADTGPQDSAIDYGILDAYVYVPTFFPLPHITGQIQAAALHQGRIYYAYANPDVGYIVVEGMSPDGGDVSRIELPFTQDAVDIAALHITDAGNIALILTKIEWGEEESSTTIWYAEYSFQGVELYRREFPELAPTAPGFFRVQEAIFTQDGGLAILVLHETGAFIYLYDDALEPREQLIPFESPETMSQTRDGRLLVMDRARAPGEISRPILREIDVISGTWGGILPRPFMRASLFPALPGDPFDLYVDDGTRLFGYDIATGAQTPFLNWTEAGISSTSGHHLHFLEDSRFSLLKSLPDGDSWRTEHVILTPVPRGELPERETIVLGGWLISGAGLDEKIAEFNRSSLTHQIQLRDYHYDEDLDWENPTAGLFQFHMDILTGQVPDIFFGTPSTLAPILDRGLAVDLHPFLDADPILCSSDFLPNILQSMETPDGRLPMISNSFFVGTTFALPETAANIESWTFSELFALVERGEAMGIPHPLGNWHFPIAFIWMMLDSSNEAFIDLTENRANLDSEDFIRVLEIAKRIGIDAADFPWDPHHPSDITQTLQGEQLILFASLVAPRYFQMHTATLGEDVVALGFPTQDGGAHTIQLFEGLAISAASPHQDAAWEFIRKILLPSAEYPWLPLRIDLLDDKISDARTPRFDGNQVEIPRDFMWTGDFTVDIYAMTEAEELAFRAIMESASLRNRHDMTISAMVQEETLPFFAGDRSAEDTARILQNRVQTVLNERR